MSADPIVREHQEWLGFLQPVGLVVSPTALKNAQARIARNVTAEQDILLRHTHEVVDENSNVKRHLNRFTQFAKEFWGWEESDLAAPPESLSTVLQEYGEILRPEFAVPGVKGEAEWQLLIQELPADINMDQGGQNGDDRKWQASPQARFERLLRDTGIPIGLLVNANATRLVYAPRGETAGHITFPFQAMCETAGRPIVAALHLLLDVQRLFALPKEQRLPAILQASRRYQNEVSIQLADQVLRALNELCRGFNEANRATDGELLAQTLKQAPEDVYGGLLATLMRLIFLLYAEDRNLMASDETYQRCYSIVGLHEKLREDDAAFHDTMDQRFGAWAQLLALSRVVHDGGGHGDWKLPSRRGRLFDPDCYPFLEGRAYRHSRSAKEKLSPPKVSDGVLFRMLEDLLFLEGERISYRALDVEQIGSVYEAMMGFEVKRAEGPSIGFKPDHLVINLHTLLGQAPGERKKWLKENLGWEPTDKASQTLKSSETNEAVLGALNSRISHLYLDRERGCLIVDMDDIYLQPTEERRRSGSHYTPRSLTEPIVKTTLDPVLKQLGNSPTPDQILNLRVCDPAMGSGAFLVESCRYLGDALVGAWAAHKVTPNVPADQDPVLHARRIVAQRCLYGVDKNAFAVDLAKLSLWLATFAKDHPFTFLDHSFRHGDSLVGLSFTEILDKLGDGSTLFRPVAEARIKEAAIARKSILEAMEDTPYATLETKYELSRQSVGSICDIGDAIVSAFFSADKQKDRERRRRDLIDAFDRKQFDVVSKAILALRRNIGVLPFHWDTEFPEVFDQGGFSAMVGNPPFLGGVLISGLLGKHYLEYLTNSFENTGNRMDLVGYFFRRAFTLLRPDGCFGLIGTKTISKGDTRSGSLKAIVESGGQIFAAVRRLKWPGTAQVVVSTVYGKKGIVAQRCSLDGRSVDRITAFLFDKGSSDDAETLTVNKGISFKGYQLSSQGFLFDDNDEKASPIALRTKLIDLDPANAELIQPYIGGEEINEDPLHQYHRYAVNFGSRSLEEASRWRDLLSLVEQRVRPERTMAARLSHAQRWWQFGETRPGLLRAIQGKGRAIVHSLHTAHWALTFLPSNWIFSHAVNVIALDSYAAFAVLQSRVHEIWARFFGSSMKDDLRYTPTDCFETFPFPGDWNESEELARIGERYFQFRAEIMAQNNQGMTATYNRFHHRYDDHPQINDLRIIHKLLDRAVLDAYGWTDLQPTHDFLLDYEETEGDVEVGKSHKRKEPWRYRWPDEFHDEVLARLLNLNRQRAAEERGVSKTLKSSNNAITARKSRHNNNQGTLNIFTEETPK